MQNVFTPVNTVQFTSCRNELLNNTSETRQLIDARPAGEPQYLGDVAELCKHLETATKAYSAGKTLEIADAFKNMESLMERNFRSALRLKPGVDTPEITSSDSGYKLPACQTLARLSRRLEDEGKSRKLGSAQESAVRSCATLFHRVLQEMLREDDPNSTKLKIPGQQSLSATARLEKRSPNTENSHAISRTTKLYKPVATRGSPRPMSGSVHCEAWGTSSNNGMGNSRKRLIVTIKYRRSPDEVLSAAEDHAVGRIVPSVEPTSLVVPTSPVVQISRPQKRKAQSLTSQKHWEKRPRSNIQAHDESPKYGQTLNKPTAQARTKMRSQPDKAKSTISDSSKASELEDDNVGMRAAQPCKNCRRSPDRCRVAKDPVEFKSLKCKHCIHTKAGKCFDVDDDEVKARYSPEVLAEYKQVRPSRRVKTRRIP